MEIINIRIYMKDDSLIEIYPCPDGCIDFDIVPYQSFLSWAIENADSSGKVMLLDNAYDTIIELTQWDDIPCPSSFVIEYTHEQHNYALGLPYSRTDFFANIVKYDETWCFGLR